MKDLKRDIVISGAGPAGLALACLLASAGFKIALIDPEISQKAMVPASSGRTAALLTGSLNILRAAGIWDAVKDVATPLQIMRIFDDSVLGSETVKTEFVARDIGQSEFGFNVPNRKLREALLAQVKLQPDIRYFSGQRLADYQTGANDITATLDDGQIITAPLIVGTDGRKSIVRAVARIEAKIRDYGQTAMTCLLAHTTPHHFTSTEIHRAGGPFTFVPMPGNTSSLVWVEKTETANRFLAMNKGAFQQAIQDRSLGLLGKITLESAPESWPLITLDAERLIAPRAVLAAEAAHVLSPIGAQGLNLSLRDVATLAEILTDAARLGEDIGAPLVLARYERRRRADIKSHTIGIDHLNRAVANDTVVIKDARRRGLQAFDKITPLKFFIMRQGLAPSMDEGRLTAGGTL